MARELEQPYGQAKLIVGKYRSGVTQPHYATLEDQRACPGLSSTHGQRLVPRTGVLFGHRGVSELTLRSPQCIIGPAYGKGVSKK